MRKKKKSSRSEQPLLFPSQTFIVVALDKRLREISKRNACYLNADISPDLVERGMGRCYNDLCRKPIALGDIVVVVSEASPKRPQRKVFCSMTCQKQNHLDASRHWKKVKAKTSD